MGLKESQICLLCQIVVDLLLGRDERLVDALEAFVDHGEPDDLHLAVDVVAHLAVDGVEWARVAHGRVLALGEHVVDGLMSRALVERHRIVLAYELSRTQQQTRARYRVHVARARALRRRFRLAIVESGSSRGRLVLSVYLTVLFGHLVAFHLKLVLCMV